MSYEQLRQCANVDKFACVINTDTNDGPGIHWVACVMDNGIGYFYNSLGDKPNPTMRRELKRIGGLDKLYYWDTQQQPDDSFKCGYYCLSFLRRFASGQRGIDLYDDLGLTPSELEKNEKIIMRDNRLN